MKKYSIKRIYNFAKRQIWFLWNVLFFKELGTKSYIDTPLKISKKHISCGKGVFVWRYCRLEAVTHWNNDTYTPEIILEDGASIQQFLHLTCAKRIHIGKNTAIAAGVTITDINHKYTDVMQAVEKQDLEVSEVFIGEDSKIYNNAVILPGTRLGKHTVVGANSVVSGIFPDYCVVVGVPAKIIKRYCFDSNQWKKTDEEGNFTE